MKKIIYGFILLSALVLFSACTKVISLIEVEITKTEYFVNEDFDYSSVKIKINYSDKTYELKDVSPEYIFVDLTTPMEDVLVTVVYEELDYYAFVTVKESLISSISFIQIGKTSYSLGEDFDVSGYKLKINYKDSSFKEVDLTMDMVEVDMSLAGKSNLIINYKDEFGYYTITKEIEIDDDLRTLEKIEVIKVGKEYYWGKTPLDLSDYIFRITYSDKSYEDVVLDNSYASVTTFEEHFEDEYVEVLIDITYTKKDVSVSTTITVYNLAQWDYEDYYGPIEDSLMIQEIYERANALMPTEIPTTTTKINFFNSSDYKYKYILVWKSSDYFYISADGTVRVGENDILIEVSLSIKGTYESAEFSWTVLVKGLGPVDFAPFDKTEKKVFAYFYEGTFMNLSASDASKIDVLNYCFATINADGTLNLNGINRKDEVLVWRRQYKLRVVLSLGGGGSSSNFGAVCISDVKRKILVESCMDVLKRYSFDGYDIDWEYPEGKDEVEGLNKFIRELRAEMDLYRDDLLFTAAVIADGNSVSGVLNRFDVPVMNEYLDYVHLMTYDLNSAGYSTHNSNPYSGVSGQTGYRLYSAETSINTYHAAGLDYSKIVIGAAFYGKISKLTTPQSPNEPAIMKQVDDTKSIKYTTIVSDYLYQNGYVYHWDDVCKAPYLSNGEYFISFENKDSIYWKGVLVNRFDLGGIMFWDYGSDSTGELLSEVFDKISRINFGNFE